MNYFKQPHFHEVLVTADGETRRILVQGRTPEGALRRATTHFGPKYACVNGAPSGYDHVLTAKITPERLELV